MQMLLVGLVGFVLLLVGLVQVFKFALNHNSKKILAKGIKHDSLHKKSYDMDISRYAGLFMNIGLITALTLCLVAFEWKTYEEEALKMLGKDLVIIDETLIETPITDFKQPPPVIQHPEIVEVPDEEEIENTVDVNLNVDLDEGVAVEQVIRLQKEEVVPEENIEPIFDVLEENASPVGGNSAFYDYIKKNLKYPAQARRMGVEGKVYVQFVVDKDGSLTEVKAIKGIGAGCDEEAMRVVKEAPKWKAGKQRGKPVKQRIVIPITFKLG